MKNLSRLAQSVYDKDNYLKSRIPELENEILNLKADYNSVSSSCVKQAIKSKLEELERMLKFMKISANKNH